MARLVSEGTGALVDGRLAASRPGRPSLLLLTSWLLGSVLLAFIVVPLIGLGTLQSGTGLVRAARLPDVRQAIWFSLEGAFLTAATAAAIGVPLAYGLARTDFRGKSILAAIVDIPLAVPHTVAGIALLYVFGRRGILGEPAAAIGLKFWGTLAGVVVGMLFVAAPYAVNAARIGFEAVDPRLEKIARTLGLGPWRTFWRVSLPLARRGILTGLVLTFARAISEFGAVVILVYYPMTAPVKIYQLFLSYGLDQAAGMAVLLLIVCLVLFVFLRMLAHRVSAPAGAGR